MNSIRAGFAVRNVLIGAGTLLAALCTVHAADSPDDDLGEVVVTGSRLRGAVAPVGSPIIQVDRTDIEASSAMTTDRLLQELPVPEVYVAIAPTARRSGGLFDLHRRLRGLRGFRRRGAGLC